MLFLVEFLALATDIKAATQLLPEACDAVGGVECEYSTDIDMRVAEQMPSHICTAIEPTAIIGVAQVQLTTKLVVERKQILAGKH